MKKNKSQKRTNMKSSILVLLLLAILLIASTYAWFTSNRTVQVSELDVNVQAKNGLQISADAVNWKSLLQLNDLTEAAYDGVTNQIPTVLEPVSSACALDEDGHLVMYYGQVNADQNPASDTKGQYILTSSVETDANANGASAGKYIAFDMYLKVQSETTIYLTSSSNVISTDESSNGLENAARIAFITEGVKEDGTAPGTIQGLSTTDPLNVKLWEPNNNIHTGPAIQNAYSLYEKTISADQAAIACDALQAAFGTVTDGQPADGVTLSETTAAKHEDYFKTMTPTFGSTKGQTSSIGSISLAPGITKVRVYMWIEGQDVDCENSASGANLGFNLQLSMDDK